MKRHLALAAIALMTISLANCARRRPPETVHHYHNTTTVRTVTPSYSKSASVGGGSSPEAFKAVTPPSSYSQ